LSTGREDLNQKSSRVLDGGAGDDLLLSRDAFKDPSTAAWGTIARGSIRATYAATSERSSVAP
jgi:hypothetical protein